MDTGNIDQGAARTAAALRVQLAQVTAAAQALERTATDARSRQYLAALDQSVCRMLRIVGRLELSGRLGGEDGPVRLENALIDLAQLTRELGERLGQLLAFAGVGGRPGGPGAHPPDADGAGVQRGQGGGACVPHPGGAGPAGGVHRGGRRAGVASERK